MPTETQNRIIDLVQSGGKALVNGIFPNDFEYYAITLELVDSVGSTVEYLTFPVNPNTIDYDYRSIANVKKNVGGVTVLNTESFVPKKYSFSGTFGRKLRILINKADEIVDPQSSVKGVFGKLRENGLQIKTSVLNAKIKSGYGTMKLLESIVEKSAGLDRYGEPMKLYLYNPTLGHSYLVVVESFRPHQDRQTSNMIWQYNISFNVIAPLDRLLGKDTGTSLLSSTKMNVLQKGVNLVANSIKRSIF